jgi:hypothetical protein
MVKVYVKTDPHYSARAFTIKFEGGGEVKFWGDPVKTVAVLILFCNSSVGAWNSGKGLEIETTDEVCTALRALSKTHLTWKEAVAKGFLQGNVLQNVLHELSLSAVLK